MRVHAGAGAMSEPLEITVSIAKVGKHATSESGDTAKIAGTEVGVTEPEATFSACFGAAFLVWHPTKYAEMLAEGVKEEARKKESARYQKKIDSRGSKFKRLRLRWRMLWSGTRGTYSRRTEKLGRNVPCPCGAMRVAPRDVTKRNKLKWCCK